MDEYNKVKYDDMVNYLKEHVDTLKDMVSEVNSYNGALEGYMWYSNDEYFYEDFFDSKDEVARAVYYGGNNYNYRDEYVRFDAYGNLETTNEWQINENLIDGAEEILDAFLEEYTNNNVDIWDKTFKDIISDYYNEEESEED
jgi:hypothetical protein